MTPLTHPTLSGGQRVILRIMKTRLLRELSDAQALELWEQCKAHLLAKKLKSTVRECEESTDGGLDTLPRGDVLDVLGHVLVNTEWPCNGMPEAHSRKFGERIQAAMDQRGYRRSEVLATQSEQTNE